MITPVKILGAQAIGNAVPRAVVEQEPAEHCLLGFEGLRRDAQRVGVQRRSCALAKSDAPGVGFHRYGPARTALTLRR
jgi:hypothetical protein